MTERYILKEIGRPEESGKSGSCPAGTECQRLWQGSRHDGWFYTICLKPEQKPELSGSAFIQVHPRDYSATTIDVMKKYPNIMKSLHLPVQSGIGCIAPYGNRGYTAESFLKLVADMKREIPDITFTTDLIVGFPDETDEDFQKTLDLVDYCKFDLAYSFVYSPRSGTPAAKLQDDTPEEVKKQRLYRLNERLAMHARENNEKYRDRIVKVLCEGRSKKNSEIWSGYSEENKLVNFSGPEDCEGKIVDVRITDIKFYPRRYGIVNSYRLTYNC